MSGNRDGQQPRRDQRPLLIIRDGDRMGVTPATIVHGAEHALREQYGVVRTFGMIGEGFNVAEGMTDGELASLRARYQRRRNLAELSHFPEGYEFMHRVQGREDRAVILLSPPDRVAVWREDGSWYRRSRVTSRDGPEPYTQDWYRRYRDHYGLPTWFMRPEALECLDDHTEARLLGVINDATEHTVRDDRVEQCYLDTRYTEEPQRPQEDPEGRHATYFLSLDDNEISRLARRFPAVAVNHRIYGFTGIYVTADRYVTLRYVLPNRRNVLQGNEYAAAGGTFEWIEENLPWPPALITPPRASYAFEGQHTARWAPMHCTLSNRPGELAAARARGAMTNLEGIPLGNGTWGWCVDLLEEQWAPVLGLQHPADVAALIGAGGLTHATIDGDWPCTTWTPQADTHNPVDQPVARGHWAYLMPADRDRAIYIFGGTRAVQYARFPTAAQIYHVRWSVEQHRAQGQQVVDSTEGINLVWVDNANDDIPPHPSQYRPDGDDDDDEDDEDDDDNPPPSNRRGTDPHTRLTHQPGNRGENNQTGTPGKSLYQTRMIGDVQYTVDRSRAHANNEQPHKGWVCQKNGTWKKYKNYGDIDWTEPDSVEKLNKWREQTYKRHDWPDKRPDDRPNYTQEERKWLFDQIKAAGGGRPSQGIAQLTADFNARFPNDDPRAEPGITGVVDRLIKEYKKHGGQQKPHVPRGKGGRKSSTQTELKTEDSDDSEAEETKEFDDDDE